MSGQTHYATPGAFRGAVESRLKVQAGQAGSRPFVELRREFIYQRFLARVFDGGGASLWVLKGGVGLLARLPGLGTAATSTCSTWSPTPPQPRRSSVRSDVATWATISGSRSTGRWRCPSPMPSG